MKKVIITNETLQSLIADVNVLATNDNKLRFVLGTKKKGDKLACSAVIVNGGAMLDRGFAVQPSTGAEITDGEPYMTFILKAKEFATKAGALLNYKADVTIADDGEKVVFSIGSTTKVTVTKVSVDAAEPMLVKDYGAYTVLVNGGNAVETLDKGGYAASFGDDKPVVVTLEDGRMDVYGVSGHGLTHYGCAIDAQYKVESSANASAEASSDDNRLCREFLLDRMKNLPEEEQASFGAEVAGIVNDPAALMELAKKYGWVPSGATSETSGKPQMAPTGKASFALSQATLRVLTKLFLGNKERESVKFFVTPKNLHIAGGNVCATISLVTDYASYGQMFDMVEKYNRPFRMCVDKGALMDTLQLMKLGDTKSPFCVTASKGGLVFSKKEDGISGSVPILGSDGDITNVKAWYGIELFSSATGILKAGNVSLMFGEDLRTPLMMCNGTLADESDGYVAILGTRDPATVKVAVGNDGKSGKAEKKAKEEAPAAEPETEAAAGE